jgi:hypothetical protein
MYIIKYNELFKLWESIDNWPYLPIFLNQLIKKAIPIDITA